MFDLSGPIFSLIGDNGLYNGVAAKMLVDLDVEVESEGGVYLRKTLIHLESGKIGKITRGDEIIHNGCAYSVESPVSDDGDMLVIEVSKQ